MKKAISGIIATILLIVVAVILVAILLSWGQNFVQQGTSSADNVIDTSCTWASVNILSCDYNSIAETIKLTIVNAGSITFNRDTNFNILLIDSDNNLDSSNLNVLDSNSLGLGESAVVTIDNYTGAVPIKLELRNTQCTGYYWAKTCN
jgi:flagellin-like protein